MNKVPVQHESRNLKFSKTYLKFQATVALMVMCQIGRVSCMNTWFEQVAQWPFAELKSKSFQIIQIPAKSNFLLIEVAIANPSNSSCHRCSIAVGLLAAVLRVGRLALIAWIIGFPCSLPPMLLVPQFSVLRLGGRRRGEPSTSQ